MHEDGEEEVRRFPLLTFYLKIQSQIDGLGSLKAFEITNTSNNCRNKWNKSSLNRQSFYATLKIFNVFMHDAQYEPG